MENKMGIIKLKKRNYVKDISKGQVILAGWINELRDLAKVKFILLRDMTGIVQCVAKPESKAFSQIPKLTIESVIALKGRVKSATVKSPDVTNNKVEIEIDDIEVISKAGALPITVTEKGVSTALPKRLDHRSIDLRKPKVKAIFTIQAELACAFRDFFKDKDFIEIQPPKIIATASEGGAGLFPVVYFEKEAFLAQSPQLYKQLVAISLEKVFSVGTVWRAEPHDTPRHLNEIRQLDIEIAFADDFDVMKMLEDFMKYAVDKTIKKCSTELTILGIKPKAPKAKYLSYNETIKILQKNKIKIKQGEDLSPEAERKLCELFPDSVVFIHSWPLSLKPFYIWPKDEKKGISAGFDALYGGIEISSGGQRVHVPEILIKRLKIQGLNPSNFKHYVDAFRHGAPYHSGWSIGLERLTMALLGLDNIREACLFPRDRERLVP